MTIKSNTKKILIFAGASTLLGIFLYAGGFYIVKEKVQETSEAVVELEQARGVLEDIETVNQSIINTQKDRDRIEEFFVDSEGIVAFIERVERLGKEVGVEATLVNLSEQNNNELVFSIEIVGSFQDVMLFAELLENLPFSLMINKAQLSKKSEQQITEDTEDLETTDSVWEGSFTTTLKSFIGDID